MDNADLTKVAFDISTSLAALNANMEQVLKKMTDHESRICNLEHYHPTQSDDSFKNEMLKLLAKATVIGLVVIGSLTGAGTIIAKMFGA